MLKYIFPILIFILHANKNITTSDLIEFNDKYYIANSYNPFSGKVIDYYNNGIKKIEGYYDNGIKSGTWLEFYTSGKLKSESIYYNNQASYTSFDIKGKINSFGMLIDNLKEGLWIEFDINGNEKSHFYFTSGILDSLIDVYVPTQINSDSLKVSKIDSIDNISFEEVKEKIIEIKNGEYVTYFDSGKYLVEFYKDDLLDGLTTLYYEDGKKNIERTYKMGSISGKTYEYNELGILNSIYQEKEYKNYLVKDGEYISYHLNEVIKEIGSLDQGYRYGKWFVFDKNSKKYKDIFYNLEAMDNDSSFIETSVTSYYPSGEKQYEYLAHSYIDCGNENLCNIYDGFQHNKEIKHGSFVALYLDGALKENGQYENGLKNGLWNEYYPSGKIFSSIDFIDGNGLYTSYYNQKNTITYEVGYYINEKRNGLWSEYDVNGQLIRRYYYNDDILNVNYPMEIYYSLDEVSTFGLSYDIDNPLVKMRFYCKGLPSKYLFDGVYEEYFIDNNLKTRGIYKDGIKYSYWKEYYKNYAIKSEVLFDEDGDGEYYSYLKSGEVSSTGFYRNYLKDGKWTTYYPNGSVEWILFYQNDKVNPNKLCSNWHETGYKKIEGFLVEYNNKVIWDGKYVEYYDNGIIYLQGSYSFGKKYGVWIEYYPNRVIKTEGEFLDNEKFDKWNYYNENGDLIKTEVYE